MSDLATARMTRAVSYTHLLLKDHEFTEAVLPKRSGLARCVAKELAEEAKGREIEAEKLRFEAKEAAKDKASVELYYDQLSAETVSYTHLATGTVSVIERREDGTVGSCVNQYVLPGKEKDYFSHPHQVLQDPSREYLLVSCQGREHGFGQVDVFKINHDGTLTPTDRVPSREIAEPRHPVSYTHLDVYKRQL